MTGAQRPHITVRVSETAASTRVEFSSTTRSVQPFKATLGRGALTAARAELDAQLMQLKDSLPALMADEARLGEVYEDLHRIGRRMIYTLFGSQGRVVRGLQKFWNDAAPFGRNPKCPPLYVDCVGATEAFLPIEFFPLFSIAPRTVTGRQGFLDACRDFVGFSCVVRRVIMTAPQGGGIALRPDADGRIRLRFLHYEHLDGAKEELRWLSSAAAHRVVVEGPYPTGCDGAPGLAEQIFDPRLSVDGSRKQVPDHIQHFACHCHTQLRRPLANEIELSGEGREVRVSLGTLGEDLVGLVASGGRRFELPLVIMNACGSARMHAAGAVSFPFLFLQNRNRGFIGSEIEIPDDLAAEFSKAMYTRLLLRRQRLGESVLGARRDLLRRFGNPLAIAYSSYADPEIHVVEE